jgi:hypothetical protein
MSGKCVNDFKADKQKQLSSEDMELKRNNNQSHQYWLILFFHYTPSEVIHILYLSGRDGIVQTTQGLSYGLDNQS